MWPWRRLCSPSRNWIYWTHHRHRGLTMYGLVFGVQAPPVVSDPNRVDVACFVGFVRRRPTPVPEVIQRWLYENGWATPPYARPELEALLDVPVPIDTWDM